MSKAAMYIHPPNSSKWDIKPPLSQRNIDSRPISLFRTLDSREARTLGLATASHKGPERHLGAGNADLQAPEMAESLRDGPQKNIRPCEMLRPGTNRFSLLGSCWEVAIHCLQIIPRQLPGTPSPACPANTAAIRCRVWSSSSPSFLRSCAHIPRSLRRKPTYLHRSMSLGERLAGRRFLHSMS